MPRRAKQRYLEADISQEVDKILDILIHHSGSYAQLDKAFRNRIIEKKLTVDEY